MKPRPEPPSAPVTRQIAFGPWSLRPPVLFAGYRMGDVPTCGLRTFPWDITETEALLINAYDFTRPKYQAIINNGWNPSRDLHFSGRPILVDSGAYYFWKENKIAVDPTDILKIEVQSKGHVGVVLDHPFPPNARDKARRIDTTIRNTDVMFRAASREGNSLELMPVIHGHSRRALRECLERLSAVSLRHRKTDVTRLGIGSVAPLAQHGNSLLAADILCTTRELLPSAHLHCFSMGSPLLMLLAIYCGVDTVDSQTWIVSAGFKYAQLPGTYATRLGRREYASYGKFRTAVRRFARQLAHLSRTEGFFVKDWSTGNKLDSTDMFVCEQYTHSLSDLESNENIHNRACHNLWIYNSEMKLCRQALQAGKLEAFITRRLETTRYKPAFDIAKKRLARRAFQSQ
jgi:queuine/archaeosine tRNA-ribosyltransferase